MRNLIPIFLLVGFIGGCKSDPDAEWLKNSSIATEASEATLKGAYRLFKNNYEISGKVVKVEEYPVSMISSSGGRYIVYHIEYRINSPLLGITRDKDGRMKCVESPKYLLQIPKLSRSPEFKVGDEVLITGWVNKINIDKVASPSSDTVNAESD